MMRDYDVNEMMRQIKRISIDAAINSGFEDDTIYVSDAGMNMSAVDVELLRKLTDVVAPQKKGKKQKEVTVNDVGLTEEKRKLAEKAKRKPKRELTPEEKEALELYKSQKEEQKKLYNLLRAVSIRLPLLFYGADADITEVIQIKDFVDIVDDESWKEFMPQGLRKELFLEILKYYDEDVVVAAGLRIRKLAKAADELPPTLRAQRIVEIISKFKNPDKETVLTPWKVVNMHMGATLGGYNFYDENYHKELDEPRMIDNGETTSDVFLNPNAKVLEMNSKSGLYPLYLAYTFYMLHITGKEKDLTLEETQKIWFDILDKHIFILCKTKMARMITARTLAGYSGKNINAIHLTKLIEERMKDMNRLSNKLTNPATWNKGGERMRFDAVVGNPPYQIEGGSGGNNDAPIYQEFAFLSKAINPRYSSLIMPARWFAAGRENLLGDFRKYMLNSGQVQKMITHTNSAELFTTVEIKGGICYYLINADYSGDCLYTIVKDRKTQTMMRNLNEFDVLIREPELSNIVSKVIAHCDANCAMVDTLISNDTPFGIASNPKSSKKTPTVVYAESTDKHNTLLYHIENNKRKCEYVDRTTIVKNASDIDFYKIFIPGGYGAGESFPHQIIGVPEYAPCNSVCSQSYLYAKFNTEIEARNFKKYLATKFLRVLVAAIKITQSAPSKVYRFVPIQDFSNHSDIDWSLSVSEIDKQLYKKYNLTDSEIEFAEINIKPMD